MTTWTDELRAKAIEMYKAAEPTGETSVEIVKEIAEDMEQSPNGVRMILTKAGVYIGKTVATKTASGSNSTNEKTTGGARVSKEAAHSRLTDAIEKVNQSPDSEIISKLTGKAAIYFAEILEAVVNNN